MEVITVKEAEDQGLRFVNNISYSYDIKDVEDMIKIQLEERPLGLLRIVSLGYTKYYGAFGDEKYFAYDIINGSKKNKSIKFINKEMERDYKLKLKKSKKLVVKK